MLLQPDWVTALGLRQELACLAALSRAAAFLSPSLFRVQGGIGAAVLVLTGSNSSETRPQTRQWHFRHSRLSLVLIEGQQQPEVITPHLWRSPGRKGDPRGTSAPLSSHPGIFKIQHSMAFCDRTVLPAFGRRCWQGGLFSLQNSYLLFQFWDPSARISLRDPKDSWSHHSPQRPGPRSHINPVFASP